MNKKPQRQTLQGFTDALLIHYLLSEQFSQLMNFDIINVTEAELWGRHPQLAAAGVIPRANKNLSLIFYGGTVP